MMLRAATFFFLIAVVLERVSWRVINQAFIYQPSSARKGEDLSDILDVPASKG